MITYQGFETPEKVDYSHISVMRSELSMLSLARRLA